MDHRNFQLNSLETFKDLFDNAHDLIHIASVSGELIYVNHAWEKLLEYSEAEVQNKSIYSFVIEPDYLKFIEYRENIIRNNEPDKEIVIGLKTKSGKIVYIEGFVSTKIKDGKPFYTRGIFRDVSLRLQNEAQLKLMNEELKEREYNLQQLLTHAPDAVIVIDENSYITYWNPKAEEIFGWTFTEAVGKRLSDTIIPAQYKEAHESGMARYLSTGEARVLNQTIDLSALDKQGREFFISLTISTTRQKGKIAFIAFLRNIDHQKKNELELEKKRKELELSNQELEQFAHVASHDMKEPVRKIRIFAEQLREESLSALSQKAKTHLEKIAASAARLTKMIDGILAYSSFGTTTELFEPVDLKTVAENVQSDLELLIEQKNAVITIDDLPEVEGVPVLLNQLFYNLLNNSLKFAKENVPPLIHMTCEKLAIDNLDNEESNHFYQISIQDNGIGFEALYAKKIFNTFSRLHSQNRYEGTGLGLSLCKRIVDYHNGKIWAESNGNDATFRFTLPEKHRL